MVAIMYCLYHVFHNNISNFFVIAKKFMKFPSKSDSEFTIPIVIGTQEKSAPTNGINVLITPEPA